MAEDHKESAKPLPQPNSLTQPFWDSATKKKLVLQRCKSCDSWVWCPRPSCSTCGGEQLEWTPVSGRGAVYSFTVIREVVGRGGRGFEKEIPYVVAWVDLEEGPRICSNVVGCSLDDVYIGMPVEVLFENVTAQITLPKFRPLQASV